MAYTQKVYPTGMQITEVPENDSRWFLCWYDDQNNRVEIAPSHDCTLHAEWIDESLPGPSHPDEPEQPSGPESDE